MSPPQNDSQVMKLPQIQEVASLLSHQHSVSTVEEEKNQEIVLDLDAQSQVVILVLLLFLPLIKATMSTIDLRP
jgi:hypothetical protein